MNNGLKTTAFAAALAATFGIAYGVGGGIGPVGTAAAQPAAGHAKGHGGDEHAGHRAKAAAAAPGGLQVSDGGYTLDLRTPAVEAGAPAALRFAVLDDATGRPLTAYRSEHGKELHLILASHDLGTYRHLHPERGADGVWSVTAALPAAGDYRLFADFTPGADGARNLTLGTDLAVGGHYRPRALPAASTTTTTTDGYRVTLKGTPVPGRERELTLTISRDGKPVTDLQPYLGAYGHLVALRAGDLAYLHVHPEEGGPGPSVSFAATAPTAGTYRLFLDFRHGGEVHTAAFTVAAGAQPAKPEAEKPETGKPEAEKAETGHAH
ncbi:hypothetical protein [Streptomyces sp. NPDC088864]|uniref:hypothetical protein n=1 Tax=Streptomyces sp. NPDC088864 TaxID=3365910 RepID=UPI0037F58554